MPPTLLVLAHLDHLIDLEANGTAPPARWRAVEEDLARLHAGVGLTRRAIGAPG